VKALIVVYGFLAAHLEEFRSKISTGYAHAIRADGFRPRAYGVPAAPVMVILMVLVRRPKEMGKLAVTGAPYWLGWASTVATGFCIIGMMGHHVHGFTILEVCRTAKKYAPVRIGTGHHRDRCDRPRITFQECLSGPSTHLRAT
jgi:hypothetical protein